MMRRFHPFWVLAGLAVSVLAAHSGALDGEFHYDDFLAITHNPAIRSWQPSLYFGSSIVVINVADAPSYQPLTVASFALNYRFGGFDPWGYLAVNLVVYLALSWMVFTIGVHLLRDARWAALAAVIFALHPVNAEAVNYVVARSSLLAALGSLVAFWGYLRRRAGGGVGWLVVGVTAFVAAVLSKESAVALILPLLAYELLGDDPASHRAGPTRSVRAAFVRLAPFLAVAGLFVAIWWVIIQGRTGPHAPSDYPIWVWTELVVRSFGLWVWPWPLGLEHPLTFVAGFDPGVAAVVVIAGVVGVVIVMLAWFRVPLLAWGLLWAVAGLVPLAPLPWITRLGLFQENRIVFSAAALAWLTAAGVRVGMGWIAGRWNASAARAAGATVVGLLLLGAVGVDRVRSTVWNDDRRLWAEVVERFPENPVARVNLGSSYADRGELERAQAEFDRTVALAPHFPPGHYALGLLALTRYRDTRASRHLDDALAALRRAVALNPRDARAHASLGLALQHAGEELAAERSYLAALGYDPHNADALNNLGAIALKRRDWSRALEHSTAALHRDPALVGAAYNRAVALVGLGRRDEAREALEVISRHAPSDQTFDPYRRAAQYLLEGGEP